MGHIASKNLYKQLGRKVDGLAIRVPWNENLYQVLKELYSEEEAEVVVKMPFALSTFERLVKTTGHDHTKLQNILENLCRKGLVIDLWAENKYWYMPSPLVVGIFEMTMMRTGKDTEYKKWAGFFDDYMGKNRVFQHANFGDGQEVSFIRTLVHEESLEQQDYVEVLDYETAAGIIEQSDKFAIGYCSCRHEKHHLGTKTCSMPLETCSSFGKVADYLVRRGMAREVSRTEMLENVQRSKELSLVLTADNIQQEATFICHCCKCCCGVLLGVTKHGYPNHIVTSSYIARVDEDVCTGCELCAKNCPVYAIEMVDGGQGDGRKAKTLRVNEDLCLGCGVCGLVCKKNAIKLVKRNKRVIQPQTTFERVILQCLERGTLQNQLFDDPASISHKAIRGILGAFFGLRPVQRALMSEQLRSVFLSSMKTGARLQGRQILTRM